MSIIQQLKDKNLRVITAESCTCGLLPDALCQPGASSVLLGGYVTYTNARKQLDLGVRTSTLKTYTEVSPQCAGEMAQGALHRAMEKSFLHRLVRLRSLPDGCAGVVALATTGFVGPYDEPLPTDDWHAYIGLKTSWGYGEVREVSFTVDARDPNRDLVRDEALLMLERAVRPF